MIHGVCLYHIIINKNILLVYGIYIIEYSRGRYFPYYSLSLPRFVESEIPTNKPNQRYGRTSLLSRSAIAASPKERRIVRVFTVVGLMFVI